jgi:hypothetical protein
MRAPRFLLVAFLALAFAPAAFAQPELAPFTEDFVAGVWKFTMPGWERRGLGIQFGPARDHFCRLSGAEGKVRAHCLGLGQDGIGIVTRETTRVRIAWGGMMRGAILDVTMGSLHGVRGTYVVRRLGVAWRAPGHVTGSRRSHRENVPDAGGKSALLGDMLLRRVSDVPKDALLPIAAELQTLGPLYRVIHMGHEDGAEVYTAEFLSGLRLCAIRQRPDGVVDRLRCV